MGEINFNNLFSLPNIFKILSFNLYVISVKIIELFYFFSSSSQSSNSGVQFALTTHLHQGQLELKIGGYYNEHCDAPEGKLLLGNGPLSLHLQQNLSLLCSPLHSVGYYGQGLNNSTQQFFGGKQWEGRGLGQ